MKNTKTISGFRFQKYDDGNVHIHDDAQGAKFICDKETFKTGVTGALKDLKGSDGVIKIKGKTKVSFYICNDSNNYSIFLGDKSVKSEIEKFMKGL